MKNIAIILFILFSYNALAQIERFKKGGEQKQEQPPAEKQEEKSEQKLSEKPFFDRLIYGGALGASFGNTTNIMLAPQVGYQFNEKFVAGPGFIYNYLKINRLFNPFSGVYEDVDIENTVYGPSAFAYYFPFKTILVGGQLEYLNFNYSTYNPINGNINTENIWQPVLWLQAGYMQPIGNNGFAQIGVRVNVLHGDRSPYANWWSPVFSFFF